MALVSYLDNHPFVRARSIDEYRECLAKLYTEPRLAITPKTAAFNAIVNSCKLGRISLSFGSYSVAMQLEFPEADQYLQLIPIRGAGEISSRGHAAIVTPDDCAIISPNCGYRSTYATDREMLALTIDAKALTAKLTELTGIHVNKPLHVELQQVRSAPVAQALREYITLLVDTISTADAPLPRWRITQAEELMMSMLLFGYQHNYSHLLERDPLKVAEWQVRRVEEYIDVNWQQPVTLESVAEVSGVSAFDLCSAFEKLRSCSPFEYAARVRAIRSGRRQ